MVIRIKKISWKLFTFFNMFTFLITSGFLIFNPEMGQMVCGNCRQLLSYPRGAIYVQCACCQTINLVLEGIKLAFAI